MIIGNIRDGIVIDHIPAGRGMDLYSYLKLGKLDCEVALIKNAESGKRAKKFHPALPETIMHLIKCKNPRCNTSCEQELPHVFRLTDREHGVYRCMYCETKAEK